MNYMEEAIKEAKKAYIEGNVPVGAVIVNNNKIISCAHNTKNSTNISVNHAEILSIIDACKKLNTWYLNDCELYVTLKPCDMCLGAIAESRIKKVYYLIESNYENNFKSNFKNIQFQQIDINNKEYIKLISSFFDELRK